MRHSRQNVHALSAVPFAVKLLPGLQVDGTWSVPTTLTFVGGVQSGLLWPTVVYLESVNPTDSSSEDELSELLS